MKEALTYLLNTRKIELKKIHKKQFKARDFRNLDSLEKEMTLVDKLLQTISEEK